MLSQTWFPVYSLHSLAIHGNSVDVVVVDVNVDVDVDVSIVCVL